jgi:hypothetical protein
VKSSRPRQAVARQKYGFSSVRKKRIKRKKVGSIGVNSFVSFFSYRQQRGTQTVHDLSLPSGDRCDHVVALPSTIQIDERPGFALMITGRGYYRSWRRGGRPQTTLQIRRAKFFSVKASADSEIARLKRRGMDCSILPVVLKIGCN